MKFRRLAARLLVPCTLVLVVITGACTALVSESGLESVEAGQPSDSELESTWRLDLDGATVDGQAGTPALVTSVL